MRPLGLLRLDAELRSCWRNAAVTVRIGQRWQAMTVPRLAIDGGEPLCAPPPPWPSQDPEVREALEKAYLDGSWGKYDGPHGAQLAQILAEMHGVKFALACCSGTFAVEWALRGLRVQPGDEVILAGYDFSGNFRAVEAVGATPVLIDLTPSTWCLDVSLVEGALSPSTKAIIASHLHGGLVAMRQLREIADRHRIAMIEDACQSPGATVQGTIAGAWGDVGVLSFGGSKLLTAGRGGALLTNREDVWQRAKIFQERGNQAFPLSELQAAVLIPQLRKLAQRNQQRLRSVERLWSETESLSALQPLRHNPPESQASYYKLAWKYHAEYSGGWSRERWIAAIRAEGVALDAGFRGFVRRGARCRRVGALTHSELAAATTVVLHHPVLLEPPATIDCVAQAIAKVTTAACHSPETENKT